MLVRNILANYVGKLWGVVSIYVFVPFYIELLGIESYGVIAFHNVVLALMLMADAGLVPAFGREMARSQDRAYLRDLLRTMEMLLLGVCALLALAVIASREWVAAKWLSGSDLQSLAVCVGLLGASAATQLAMSLYSGGLMGLQLQARANAYAVVFSMVRSGLVLVPLWFEPDLRVYFAWQLGSSLLFLLLLRGALWRALGGAGGAQFALHRLQPVFRYALGMMGMAIVAALNTQMDKLVTSFMLTLKDYAVYSLAAVASQAPMMLTLPVALALLPRLTQHVEARRDELLRHDYLQYARLIAVIAAAVAAFCVYWAEPLVRLWTSDVAVAQQAAPVLQLLMAGSLLLSLQLMPYHLALAHGHNATNLKLGAIFLVLNPLLMWFLTREYGLIGAAAPWGVMNLTALLVLGYALNRRFVPDIAARWARQSVVMPVIAVGASVVAVSWSCRAGLSAYVQETGALILAMVCTAVIVLASVWRQFSDLYRQVRMSKRS